MKPVVNDGTVSGFGTGASAEQGWSPPAPREWYLHIVLAEWKPLEALRSATLKAFHSLAQGCPTFVGLPWVRMQHNIRTLKGFHAASILHFTPHVQPLQGWSLHWGSDPG